jgi:hypothetical protein
MNDIKWGYELVVDKKFWEEYLYEVFVMEGIDFEVADIANGYPFERVLIMSNIELGDFAFSQLFKQIRARDYQERDVTEADFRL